MESQNINPETIQLLYEKVDEILQTVKKEKQDYPLKDRWLDIQEACLLLKVSKRTIQSYRDNGLIPFSQIAGKIYFRACDLQSYLEKHYHKGNNSKK